MLCSIPLFWGLGTLMLMEAGTSPWASLSWVGTFPKSKQKNFSKNVAERRTRQSVTRTPQPLRKIICHAVGGLFFCMLPSVMPSWSLQGPPELHQRLVDGTWTGYERCFGNFRKQSQSPHSRNVNSRANRFNRAMSRRCWRNAKERWSTFAMRRKLAMFPPLTCNLSIRGLAYKDSYL